MPPIVSMMIVKPSSFIGMERLLGDLAPELGPSVALVKSVRFTL
jgi:hypothetical protein